MSRFAFWHRPKKLELAPERPRLTLIRTPDGYPVDLAELKPAEPRTPDLVWAYIAGVATGCLLIELFTWLAVRK